MNDAKYMWRSTIVPWPNPKQWPTVHISHLVSIISTNISFYTFELVCEKRGHWLVLFWDKGIIQRLDHGQLGAWCISLYDSCADFYGTMAFMNNKKAWTPVVLTNRFLYHVPCGCFAMVMTQPGHFHSFLLHFLLFPFSLFYLSGLILLYFFGDPLTLEKTNLYRSIRSSLYQ